MKKTLICNKQLTGESKWY